MPQLGPYEITNGCPKQSIFVASFMIVLQKKSRMITDAWSGQKIIQVSVSREAVSKRRSLVICHYEGVGTLEYMATGKKCFPLHSESG